jgi:energy-converting hydrogenase Eha subunit A
MSENILYLVIVYIVLALGAAVAVVLANPDDPKRYRMGFVFSFIWPVTYVMIAIIYMRGRYPGKCGWCGKQVGPITGKMDLWSSHYLNECKEHPLAKRIEELETENALLKETQMWIPVSERLPETSDDYIVYKNDCIVDIDYYDEGEWFLYDDKITHWRPLPEPPTEGTQE